MGYTPLHINSGHSILRSSLRIKRIVGLARKEGFKASGLCDLHTLSGLAEFDETCKIGEIAPILGMDIEVGDERFSMFIQNEQGYLNAIALDFQASLGPLKMDFVREHASGLIFVYDCDLSSIKKRMKDSPTEIPNFLTGLFKGLGEVYFGLPYLPEERGFISFLRSFCAKYPYPLVAFPHILYQKKEDAIALEILRAIDEGKTLEEKKKEGIHYYLSKDEVEAYYTPEEIAKTEEIALFCKDFEFDKVRGSLLVFRDESSLPASVILKEKVYQGLARKKPNAPIEYKNRIEYELGVIERMGYSSYFLIVENYVKYALEHGISVGPGRGSGASSLVSYCLDIVTPDPIENELLFERFLNPERQSMPDIDVDFADIRRDEISGYLKERFGKERVAHIITFQTFGAKAALRDIGRVFSYRPEYINDICKTLPDVSSDTLGDNYRKNQKFRQFVDSDPYNLEILSLAAKIEGLPRQPGIHPAGVVLNEAPLYNAIPVHADPTWGLVCQYEMGYLEHQGFLKMDLLGLRNLTYVDRCLDILKNQGIQEKAARDLPFDDPKAISLIASGKVMGLFQLESGGMKRAIRTLAPTTFNDVAALLALYRPGPMENIPSYAARKAGKERITYLCPELEPILASTYGIIVYQEQILQILRAMAGFTYGQADSFRRAISKKDVHKMESLKGGFIKGCLEHGKSRETAEKVYSLIYRFADYGFNKAHAVSYAVLTCQMAYLKANYPQAFYASILDGTSANDNKFKALSSEIKQSGYRYLLPDVNRSFLSFAPEGEGIRFPLTSIKGINSYFCNDVVNERIMNGEYKDIFDFALRTKQYGLTSSIFVKLVDGGCFDSLNPNRESLRVSSDSIVRYAEMFTGANGRAMLLELDFPKPQLADIKPRPMDDLVAEKEALGVMISGSLLISKQDIIKERHYLSIDEIRNTGYGVVACILSKSRVVMTKKGTKLCFLTVYDDDSEMDLMMFEGDYNKAYPLIKEGNMLAITAKRDTRRMDSFLASDIVLL